MPNTSNHGGASAGAGRKPNSTKAFSATEHLYWGRQQLTQALPQLFDALKSLAEGATTTHERWVAAGTLTTGSGENKGPMFPQLAPAELVLVARDTYAHKPDHKALISILQPFLDNLPNAPEELPQSEIEEDEQIRQEQEPEPEPTPQEEPQPQPQPQLSPSADSPSPFLEKSPLPDNSSLSEQPARPRFCGIFPLPASISIPQKYRESPTHSPSREEITVPQATIPPL